MGIFSIRPSTWKGNTLSQGCIFACDVHQPVLRAMAMVLKSVDLFDVPTVPGFRVQGNSPPHVGKCDRKSKQTVADGRRGVVICN